MIKFLIVGASNIDKYEIVNTLLVNKDMFTIAKIFTTKYENIYDDYHYFLSNEELNICYKNNALLYVNTNDYISEGITLESFYNNNVIFMNTENFNNISNKVFNQNNDDLIIIWVDTKNHKNNPNINKEIKETNYFIEKLESEKLKYLYFLDKSPIEIMDVIVEYLTNSEKRSELIEIYS